MADLSLLLAVTQLALLIVLIVAIKVASPLSDKLFAVWWAANAVQSGISAIANWASRQPGWTVFYAIANEN